MFDFGYVLGTYLGSLPVVFVLAGFFDFFIFKRFISNLLARRLTAIATGSLSVGVALLNSGTPYGIWPLVFGILLATLTLAFFAFRRFGKIGIKTSGEFAQTFE